MHRDRLFSTAEQDLGSSDGHQSHCNMDFYHCTNSSLLVCSECCHTNAHTGFQQLLLITTVVRGPTGTCDKNGCVRLGQVKEVILLSELDERVSWEFRQQIDDISDMERPVAATRFWTYGLDNLWTRVFVLKCQHMGGGSVENDTSSHLNFKVYHSDPVGFIRFRLCLMQW